MFFLVLHTPLYFCAARLTFFLATGVQQPVVLHDHEGEMFALPTWWLFTVGYDVRKIPDRLTYTEIRTHDPSVRGFRGYKLSHLGEIDIWLYKNMNEATDCWRFPGTVLGPSGRDSEMSVYLTSCLMSTAHDSCS